MLKRSQGIFQEAESLQYVVLKGNNSRMVTEAMQRRPWWKEAA